MAMFKLQHISNFDSMMILASQSDGSDNTKCAAGYQIC